MKKLAHGEVLNLTFGTKIKIVYHNSVYHQKNEVYRAVVFGDKIGYEDGVIDHLRIIAEQVYDNVCKVYVIG